MDHSHFKSSEELGIRDEDVLFMSSFSSRLQLEPFPTERRRRSGSLIAMIGLIGAGSGLLWWTWPIVRVLGRACVVQVESNMGISLSLLLGLIGLAAGFLIEVGPNQVGDIL
jgi:hypothetical protein